MEELGEQIELLQMLHVAIELFYAKRNVRNTRCM